MQKNKILKSTATLLASALLGLAAHAATPTPAGCNANEAKNDPAACKRESGAARAEAKKGNLTAPGAAAEKNATARCATFTGAEKTDCLTRMKSETTETTGAASSTTTTTSGSVNGGGQLRETTTTTVTPAKP